MRSIWERIPRIPLTANIYISFRRIFRLIAMLPTWITGFDVLDVDKTPMKSSCRVLKNQNKIHVERVQTHFVVLRNFSLWPWNNPEIPRMSNALWFLIKASMFWLMDTKNYASRKVMVPCPLWALSKLTGFSFTAGYVAILTRAPNKSYWTSSKYLVSLSLRQQVITAPATAMAADKMHRKCFWFIGRKP